MHIKHITGCIEHQSNLSIKIINFQIVCFNVQLGFPVGHSRGKERWRPTIVSRVILCSPNFTCRASIPSKTPQPWLPVALVPCLVPCSHNDVLPPSLPSLPRMSWPLCGINRSCWCYCELLLSLGRLEHEWELGGWWEDTSRDTVFCTCIQLSLLMQPYYLRTTESVTQLSFQLGRAGFWETSPFLPSRHAQSYQKIEMNH